MINSRSRSKSLAELGLASPSFLLDQVPRTADSVWPRGGDSLFQVHNVLFLALDLNQRINKGSVLCPICSWPALWSWAGDSASLGLSFPFHCKMGLFRPTSPVEETQREDVGEVPSALPGPLWVAQDSGYGVSFSVPA